MEDLCFVVSHYNILSGVSLSSHLESRAFPEDEWSFPCFCLPGTASCPVSLPFLSVPSVWFPLWFLTQTFLDFGVKALRDTPGWSHLDNFTSLCLQKLLFQTRFCLPVQEMKIEWGVGQGCGGTYSIQCSKDLRMWRTVRQMSFCIKFVRWTFITTERQYRGQFRPIKCSWYYGACEQITRYTMEPTSRVLLTERERGVWWVEKDNEKAFLKIV